MSDQRLTLCLAGHVYFTKGTYSETIPAEMTTADVRMALSRLADYENACYDSEGNEIVEPHAIHVLRESKNESLQREQEPVISLRDIDSAPTIESPRWTPCADGENLPPDGVYDVTLKNRSGTLGVVTGYLVDGKWANTGLYAAENIIAWKPKPDPYNPNHIRDATKKIDQDDVSRWPDWKKRAATCNYEIGKEDVE